MILVCGEALFDVFVTGRTPGGLALDARIGGSPFNVALGLARLGQPVAFLGGIGRGPAGERLMEALADEGIDARWVARLDAPTTLCLVGLDAAGVPSYELHGDGCADRRLGVAHLPTLTDDVRALHFGSYAMVVGETGATQRALVAREHTRRVVAYDPNVRTTVEPDLQRWRETLAWMTPRTHVLKISDEDLGRLHPGVTPPAFAQASLDAGAACVIVTRGAEGALAFTRAGAAAVASTRVAVVDTVGAGDTFQAAWLTWLAEQRRLDPAAIAALDDAALEAALQFATHAAAVTCSRRGADLPRRHELTPVR